MKVKFKQDYRVSLDGVSRITFYKDEIVDLEEAQISLIDADKFTLVDENKASVKKAVKKSVKKKA